MCTLREKHRALQNVPDDEPQPSITWRHWSAMQFILKAKTDANVMPRRRGYPPARRSEPPSQVSPLRKRRHLVSAERVVAKKARSAKLRRATEDIPQQPRPKDAAPTPPAPPQAPPNTPIDTFATFVATSLRSMMPAYSDRAMAEIKLQLATAASASAHHEIRRNRVRAHGNPVWSANGAGQLSAYYAFGEDDTPYTADQHNSFYILATDGTHVTATNLLEPIRRAVAVVHAERAPSPSVDGQPQLDASSLPPIFHIDLHEAAAKAQVNLGNGTKMTLSDEWPASDDPLDEES